MTPEYCWCGEPLKSEMVRDRQLSDPKSGPHRVYECPVHGPAWRESDRPGDAR